MTDDHHKDAEGSGADAQGRSKEWDKAGRRRAFRFVIVFVTCVFVLFAAYRFAVDTKLNAWYLFQVGRSTAFVLDKVAYSCEVENVDAYRGREAEVRAALQAWGRGEDAPARIPQTSEEPPLTSWEVYMYRQEVAVRANPDRGYGEGPTVQLIVKPGMQLRIRELETRITQAEEEQPDESGRIAEMRAELSSLQAELDALEPEERRQAMQGKSFHFRIVPECGAIEVMAIFIAAIMAFPTSWWRRLAGIALGIPLLYGVNVFRLVCLALLGAYDESRKYFDFVHEYLWQGIYIIFVLVVWLLWVEFIVKGRES